MNKIQRFEDLDVWQKSAALYKDISVLYEQGKLKNDFTAKDQLKRAALSISKNIAEGYEYENNLQFIRFLKYAKGSAGELRSMISILYERELIGETQSKKLIQDVTFISQSIKNFMKYLVNHYQSTK